MHSKRAVRILLAATLLLPACNEPAPQPTASAPPARSAPAQSAASAATAPPESSPPEASAAKAPEALPAKIAAQHLLVAYKGAASVPKGVTRTKAEARKRVEEAARRAQAGEDFSQLVAEYSDDGTKANRGNLGVFTPDKMVKPFADAAFALPVDGVSGVVETKFGFHVIKRNQ
jgi:hypothetical protein